MLLELKLKTNIVGTDILTLEKNIEKLINFFKEFKKILKPEKDNKDKFIISQYLSLEEKYKEYFYALKDYSDYLIKYDKSKSELLTIESINENNKVQTLSIENAMKYLEIFN
jgi:hypothetical protein